MRRVIWLGHHHQYQPKSPSESLGAIVTVVLACMLAVQLLIASPVLANKRVALVIGNSKYENLTRLANPANDAIDLTSTLKGLDFEVISGVDLDREGFERTIGAFRKVAPQADVVFFFFSGHGIQYQGTNYLAPVDARAAVEQDITTRMIRVQDVMADIQRAKPGAVKLFVLDACRDNQFIENLRAVTEKSQTARGSGQTATRGFVPVGLAPERVDGMLIAFATQANAVALDGTSKSLRNSPFTASLLREIVTPGQEVRQVFQRVRTSVYEDTRGSQLPELSDSLIGDFYFTLLDKRAASAAELEALIFRHRRETSGRFLSVQPSPDGRHALTLGEAGDREGGILYDGHYTIRYWDLSRGVLVRELGSSKAKPTGFAVTEDGATVLVNNEVGDLEALELATGRSLRVVRVDPGPFVLTQRDQYVVSSNTTSRLIKVWERASGRQVKRLGPVGRRPMVLAASRDGRYVIVGDEEASASVWDLQNGKLVASLDRNNSVTAAAFAPDGRTFATGPHPVRIWETSTGKLRRTIAVQEGRALTFSPDGSHLYVAGARRISSWTVATGELSGELESGQFVSSLAFSTNGRALLAADQTLTIWDTQSRERLASIRQFPKGNWLSVSQRWGYASSGDVEAFLALDKSGRTEPVDDAFRRRWRRSDLRAVLGPTFTGRKLQGFLSSR